MKQVISLSISVLFLLSLIFLRQDKAFAESNKFNMTFLYGGNSSYYLNSIEKAQGSLDMVSPSYFDLNADGSLKLVNIDQNFINTVHSKGIKIMPFLSNHWNRELGRTALANRERLTDEIISALNRYNLDGINVDIENLTPEDKNNLTDLVKILKRKLPAGKEISVSVSANSQGLTTGWHGSYDVKALADNSNYLIVMAYDESAGSQTPRAGASFNFVEKSVKHLLNKNVASQKIVLGMPFYGRYWSDRDPLIKANSIHLTAVDNLISRFNPTVNFDQVSKSPMFKFSVKEGQLPVVIGGKVLSVGEYTVWYENNDSIKAKLGLVTKYNLKGAGSWRLGQENPDLWNYYNLWLNDKYFKDIIGHWAEYDIVYNINKGLMVGMNSREFVPNGSLTRAQAAVVISRFANSDNTAGVIDESRAGFSDVPSSHWAYDYILDVQRKGIITGFEDNTFRPDEVMTREQIASILDRLLKVDENTEGYENYYTDITKDRWSYESIIELTKLGLLKGYENREFRPTNKITRAEMASLMYRVDTKSYEK